MIRLTESMHHLVERLGSGRVTTRTSGGGRQDIVHSWLAVWSESTLVLVDVEPDGATGATVRNAVESPPVEVAVVDPVRGRGYRFQGHARVLLSGPTFDRVRAFYTQRGLRAPFEHVVFVDVIDAAEIAVPGAESDEAAGDRRPRASNDA